MPMAPHPANLATPDLMLEIVSRIVEDQKEHSRVISGFLRLLRLMTMPSSQRQRQHTAAELRDLADDLEAAVPISARRQMGREI
jgi:hypothetical protein